MGDSYEGTLKNGYLYNGKELFDDADLNWYDYGFRNYDQQIGRFTQLDPLTHDYPYLTPFQYASCDPITNIDIDGLEGGSAVGVVIGGIGKGITEAAEHGGTVKELVGIVVTASYAVNNAIKGLPLALSAGNIIQVARVAISKINSNPATKQAGNKGAIVMNTERYNHHSGRYLSTTNRTGGSSGSSGGKSSGDDGWGQNYTSEFGGGNNARLGRSDEPSINIDFLMAVTSSWMGEDVKLAKTWEEMIEKLPSRLKEGNEIVETHEYLEQKKELEKYLKNPSEETSPPTPVKFEEKSNSTPKINPETIKDNPYNKPHAVIYSRHSGMKTKKQGSGRVITQEPATDTFPIKRGYGAYYPMK